MESFKDLKVGYAVENCAHYFTIFIAQFVFMIEKQSLTPFSPDPQPSSVESNRAKPAYGID